MDRWQYAAVLAACLTITLPLELFLGARVYRRPARLVRTLAPTVAAFVTWDLVAAQRGHWWWSTEQMTGVRVLGLPIEEWLFFIVVPICALLTYEVLGTRLEKRRRQPRNGTPAKRRSCAQPTSPIGVRRGR